MEPRPGVSYSTRPIHSIDGVQMEQKNGSSVLDSSSGTAVFCARLLVGIRNNARPLSYGLILYLALATWSSAFAANVFTGECQLYNNYGNALIAAQSMDTYLGQVNCNGSTQNCTHTYATQGFQSGCPGWDTDAGYPSSQEYAQVQVGYTLDHYDSGTSTFYYDIHLAFRANGDICPDGTTADENGACIETNECDTAYLDDEIFSQEIASNPGLCAVGDFSQFNETNICTYSESATRYCEATHYGTVTWEESLPDLFIENGGITFTSNPCTGAGTVSGYEFPACGDLPPTCPPGTYYDGVSCSSYSDVDNETPPDPQSAERTRTDTITESVVDNGDGTTTTTRTTETSYGPCPPGEDCTGGFDYEGPGDREAKTFQESIEAFWDSIQGAPIASSADGIAAAVPETSTCPTWTSDSIALLGGDTLTLDAHCAIADEYSDSIRTIMLIVYSIIGLLILLSA